MDEHEDCNVCRICGEELEYCLACEGVEWISCKGVSPEENKTVMLFVPERKFVEYTYKDEIELGYFESDRYYIISNGDYLDGGYGQDYRCEPSHWQPLPPPPGSKL